ncbi:hypothetical protein LVB87_07340 [Lysobacter sp. KIS68-7]|uniref:hypothetical protein n=1 Tax=Lysobacter sp. KIS68-7 TaxID=2904252 RepID=UPI001E5228F5|nr:hypothetical protein [Lysobacter sp. KIS68-7]UHQ20940.1 hypothetical protein LVB87_07340 [Lysobacter sp. KIS68-7]
MTFARGACAMLIAFALSACVGAAPQAPASTKPTKPLRTGGPLPPERVEDLRCKVQSDCKSKRACAGDVECRCVEDKCVQSVRNPEPVTDPVPPPPPVT